MSTLLTNREEEKKEQKDEEDVYSGAGKSSIRLMKHEATIEFGLMEGVTAGTFYEGQLDKAVDRIRDRLLLVAKANPWILGRLTKDSKAKSGENVFLVYDPRPEKEQLSAFVHVADSRVGQKMGYNELFQVVRAAGGYLPTGWTQIKNQELAFRITFLRGKEDGKFFMVVSMAHVIGDGTTFYQLVNMLSSDGEIVRLNAKRKHDYCENVLANFSKSDVEFTESIGFFMNWASAIAFKCGTARAYSHYVDAEAIAQQKEEAKKDGKVPYVSSNDILTSHFGNFTKARILMMAMNQRARMNLLGKHDAGVYEREALLDPDMFGSPSGIRKLLIDGAPYSKRGGSATPGFFKTLRAKFSFITNLASSFNGELKIDGCKSLLHLPIYNPGRAPVPIGVLYYAQPGKLAALYLLPKPLEMLGKHSPLGDCVSTELFHN